MRVLELGSCLATTPKQSTKSIKRERFEDSFVKHGGAKGVLDLVAMQSYLACPNQVLPEVCYEITAEMEALQFNTHSLLKLELVGHDPRWPILVWVDGDPNAVDIKQVLVCCEHPMQPRGLETGGGNRNSDYERDRILRNRETSCSGEVTRSGRYFGEPSDPELPLNRLYIHGLLPEPPAPLNTRLDSEASSTPSGYKTGILAGSILPARQRS